jgi:hypothetical protein
MEQTLTFITGFWRNLTRAPVRVSLEIDHDVPGSHLIWDIANTGDRPVTLTKLLVDVRNGVSHTMPLGLPHVLAPQDHLILPTDIDWTILNARSVAAVDEHGREYHAPRQQLASIRNQMRAAIDRPANNLSARDFLFGAADLVFGVMILGLGFFMLMYAIATG